MGGATLSMGQSRYAKAKRSAQGGRDAVQVGPGNGGSIRARAEIARRMRAKTFSAAWTGGPPRNAPALCPTIGPNTSARPKGVVARLGAAPALQHS